MRHDIKKKIQHFKKEQDYQRDCRLFLHQKNVHKGSFIVHQSSLKWCANNEILAWYNSEIKCQLKMRFCTDTYFMRRFA